MWEVSPYVHLDPYITLWAKGGDPSEQLNVLTVNVPGADPEERLWRCTAPPVFSYIEINVRGVRGKTGLFVWWHSHIFLKEVRPWFHPQFTENFRGQPPSLTSPSHSIWPRWWATPPPYGSTPAYQLSPGWDVELTVRWLRTISSILPNSFYVLAI